MIQADPSEARARSTTPAVVPAAPPAAAAGEDPRSQTLERLGGLAVQPGVVMELAKLADDDREGLIDALEREPAISARVLSVLNSAKMGLRHEVRSIARAVGMLGPAYTRSVALVYGMRGFCGSSGLGPELSRSLWLATLRKAVAAKLAAKALCPRYADEAFTAGLIQDVGLAPLAALDPGFYQREMFDPARDPEPWCERERQHFGIDHAQAGERLLERWSMTGPLVQGIRDHHTLPGSARASGASDSPGQVGADDPGAGDRAVRRLPGFIAALLPHSGTQPSPRQRQWLEAAHARLLMDHYNTPDAFLAAVGQEASLLAGIHAAEPAMSPGAAAEAAADQAVALVHKLCRLDKALAQSQDSLTDLRHEAFTDELTRVLNRRGFHRLAAKRLDQALAGGRSACCVMLDLDRFKLVNDRYGHAAGDRFLRGTARLLRRNIDRTDLIGRMGGDEFAALFIGTSREEARGVVRRLHESCRGRRIRIEDGVEIALSFSLGAAYFPALDPGASVDSLLAAADQAMYQSKRISEGNWSFTDADEA